MNTFERVLSGARFPNSEEYEWVALGTDHHHNLHFTFHPKGGDSHNRQWARTDGSVSSRIVQQIVIEIPNHVWISNDVETCQDWIRSAFVKIATHEVDEFLLFDGERVFDPHTTDGRIRRYHAPWPTISPLHDA